MFALRKSLNGRMYDTVPLKEQVAFGVSMGVYDKSIQSHYTDEELDILDGYIDHDRGFKFTYAGLRQVVDKYLVQDSLMGGFTRLLSLCIC